jgi:hypothetical protein
MRTTVLGFLLVILLPSGLYAQENPFLRIETKRNFFNQKVEILDGPRSLRKEEVTILLAEDPDALAIYQKSLRRNTLNSVFAATELGLFVGTTYLVFAPRQQSSTVSNLFWPFTIGTLAVGIASGIFRRDVRNLTREAVDLYNFGNQNGPPVYFQENRIDQPIFSFKVPIR